MSAHGAVPAEVLRHRDRDSARGMGYRVAET